MDKLKVEKLIVGAQDPESREAAEFKYVNHWHFSLQTSKTTSVSLDLTPSGNAGRKDTFGTLGTLVVQDLKSVVSGSVVKSVEVSLASSVTVKDLVSAIEDKRYENYGFNEKGIGCRYWVTKVLQLFKEKGFVGSISDVVNSLPKGWGVSGELPHGKSVENGTFH